MKTIVSGLMRSYLAKFKARKRPFLSFQIEPTSRCQLKCVMCPKTAFQDEWKAGDMPLSVFKRISGYFHLTRDVHLQGWGEPLLYPELLAMIRIARVKGCQVSLTTNGMLLSPDRSEKLIEEGLDIIAVSLAGASKETHEAIRCGSHFDTLFANVKALSALKAKLKSKTPKVVFSYLMTRTNIEELPDAVRLAREIGVNELVANNLDYTPTETQNDLKVFSCLKADSRWKGIVYEAGEKARQIKLPFRCYPVEMEEVIMCELNPLHIVFFSHDGSVSPCVYLNLPRSGSIPRIFCGSSHEIPRMCFGNAAEKDFIEIWNNPEYMEFRKVYQNRLDVFEKTYGHLGPLTTDRHELEEAEKILKNDLSRNPLPEGCRTCYKAYGI
ncbi:MAG: radical SAM protein [Thermodesulfobacteriota bacterium]